MGLRIMKKFLLAAVAATVFSATSAGAATITINSWTVGANLIGSVAVGSPSVSHSAIYINQFRYQGHDAAGNVFDQLTNCVDLGHYVATGSYTLQSITTRIPDLAKLRQMLTFVGNTKDIVANSTGQQKNINAAAMQLGIWEILYEGGTANYNVTSGNFSSAFAGHVSAADFAAAQTQANAWLANTSTGTWTSPVGKTLGYFTAPNAQGQMYLRDLEQGEKGFLGGPGSVPEPSQWALMLSGFGFAGWAARRRRHSSTVTVTA